MMLREIEKDLSDPNTYREVALLNRLLTGHDIESEAEKRKSVDDSEKAARVLVAKGVTPESAQRIAKVLSSLRGDMGEPSGPDDPDDEPDETAA